MAKISFPIEVMMEKLTPGGEGVGFYDGIPVHVYGLFPGEKGLIQPRRKVTRKKIEGYYDSILEPADFRREPEEEHYLSCSPWQVIPENKQREYKKSLAVQLFKPLMNGNLVVEPEIDSTDLVWGYRNKMEFSFAEDNEGKLATAFYQRSKYNRFAVASGCRLCPQTVNECLQKIVGILREKGFSKSDFKNLGFRYSFMENQCLATLYVKREDFPVFDVSIDHVAGWRIVYSTPLSPAACVTKVLHEQGRSSLVEKVNGFSFEYPMDSFFQINPLTFGLVLDFVKEHKRGKSCLVDLYSGVGTFGIALSPFFEKVVCVESDALAAEIIRKNSFRNNVKNISVISSPAEKTALKEIFTLADTLIVDPNRGGLHPKVTKAISDFGTQHFIYVSCNQVTQAQDFSQLKQNYEIAAWRLFDLYPQTPHVESVLVLERI